MVVCRLIHCSLELPLRFEPHKWCVVHPGVEDVDGVTNDALGRELLGTESVKHIVLLLDAKLFHA